MAKKNPSVLWNVDQSGDVIGSTGRATAQGNIGLGSTIVTPNRDGKKFITHISRIGTPGTGEVAGELKANLDDVRLADIAATPADATRSVVTNADGKMTAMSMELDHSSGSADIVKDTTNPATTFVAEVSQTAQGKVTYTTKKIRSASDESDPYTGSHAGITALTSLMCPNGSRTTGITTAVTPTGVWDAIDSAIGTLTLDQVTQNLLSSSTNAEYPVILKYSTATSGSVTNTVNYAAGVTVNPKDASVTATTFKGSFVSGVNQSFTSSGTNGSLTIENSGLTAQQGSFQYELNASGMQFQNGPAGTNISTGAITTSGDGSFGGTCTVSGRFTEGNRETGEYVDIVNGAMSLKSNTAGETLKYTTLDHTSIETNGTCWVAGKISEGAKISSAYTGRYVEINDGVISTKHQDYELKYTQIDYDGINTSGLIQAGAIKAGVAQYAGRYTSANPEVYDWPADKTNLLLTYQTGNDVAIDLKNLTVGYVYWLHIGRNRKVKIRFSGGTVQRTIYIYENTWDIPVGDTSFWDINVRGNPAIPFIRASDDVIYVLLSYGT